MLETCIKITAEQEPEFQIAESPRPRLSRPEAETARGKEACRSGNRTDMKPTSDSTPPPYSPPPTPAHRDSPPPSRGALQRRLQATAVGSRKSGLGSRDSRVLCASEMRFQTPELHSIQLFAPTS